MSTTPSYIGTLPALPLVKGSNAPATPTAPVDPPPGIMPRKSAQDGEEHTIGNRYTLPVLNPLMLREWRLVHNYTAAELAKALDVSETTINRWERGEREAPWRMLQLALHGLVFTHGASCRCGHPRCSYRPNRYAANGRAYDPR